MSKRTFLFGLSIVALAPAFVTVDHFCWSPGLTKANMRRIRVGMTLEEVKAILGNWPALMGQEGHPAFWADRVSQDDLAYASGLGNGRVVVNWADNKVYKVQVCFRGGRVVQPVIWIGPKDDPGPLAHLRAWLGW